MRLTDKVSIITGGGQGIGRATALKFAAEGAKVAVCDINQAAVDDTVREILASGREAVGFNVDVTDKESIARMVAGVMAKWGRIDTLVNNAGIVQDAQFKKMTDEQFERVIDVNLKGVYHCTKAVVDIMLEQNSGVILNASSIVGLYGNFGQTNYAAAKAGIVAFARTWALELARAQITVNAIVPTAWTRMTETIPIYAPLAGRDEFPAQVRQEHALGPPEDCAPLVVFLASEAGAGVTGQAIGIGGDRLTLYSHPAEVAFELREGGWSAEEIAVAWKGFEPQPYGVRLPELDLK